MAKTDNDFSDRVVSAYNKYVFVAAISIAASSFTIKGDSGFLGLNFENLNERALELGLFVSTLVLGINYALRIWDEFYVFSTIDTRLQEANKKLEESKDKALNLTKVFSDTVISYEKSLKNSPYLCDDSLFKNMKSTLKNLRSIEVKTPMESITTQSLFYDPLKEIIQELKEIVNNQNDIKHIAEKNLIEIKELKNKEINKITDNLVLNIFQKKNFLKINKLRIIMIDIAVPIIMLLFVFLSFFYPNENSPILQIVDYLFETSSIPLNDATMRTF